MLKFRKKVLFLQLIFFTSSTCLFLFSNIPFWLIQGLYGFLTFFSLFLVSRPLQKMIDSIRPLEEGYFAPSLSMDQEPLDEELKVFNRFINSLLEKIRKQIGKLQEQKQETEEILDSLEEGVIALDKRGIITFANQKICKQLNLELNQILGRMFFSLDIESSLILKECYELIQKVLQTSETAEQNFCEQQKEKLYLRLIAYPRSRHNGVVLMIQDRTSDYKVLEMGKDFIANASHELRTPITIIQGFAEMLHEHPDLSLETLKDIGGKIVKTSKRLEKLIQSLLTLADLENLVPERFQLVDLVSICEQSIHLFLHRHQFKEKELTAKESLDFEKRIKYLGNVDLYKAQAPIYVMADPFLLELAITNLLDNAFKYCKEEKKKIESLSSFGASLTLSIDGKMASVTVKDQGIGIPKEELSHLFDRFYTVDKARSRKSGGAGLGLAIVKTIIEKHQGKISVESELEKGSSFSLYLPFVSLT